MKNTKQISKEVNLDEVDFTIEGYSYHWSETPSIWESKKEAEELCDKLNKNFPSWSFEVEKAWRGEYYIEVMKMDEENWWDYQGYLGE